jgi:2,4-dienoyl-CoA reductase-like NADH-dependent reductase (Old Yellow Enzyme family)/thioredoxin reductase
MKYKFLEPIKIGPITLKNRILRPAVAESICNVDGTVTEQYVEYYRNVARGGVALITPGISVIDDTAPYISYKQPFLTNEKFIPGLKKVVDAVRREGAKITFQLWHSGQFILNGKPHAIVNNLSNEDIEILKQKYYNAARICKEAGADGVEYHIAHNYLPSQFMSKYFNKRTDKYGSDTIENAMRFSIECIDMIRVGLCNDAFVITVKLTGNDFIEGGITPEWAAQGAKLLEKAGVVLITVNAGGAITGYEYMSDNGRQPEGWKVHLAEAVKREVSIPVAASGNLRNPQYVHEIIAQGKADMIAVGRGTIAEPEWVKKTAEDREDEMRYCISCLYCLGSRVPEDGSHSGCTVNPYAKCEFVQPNLVKDGNKRKVAIIGAGPAGLEAAVTLAERGFTPVIYEKKSYLGGQIEIAKVPPFKTKLKWMIEYYEKQIKRLGIEVHMSTEVTVATIEQLNPYAVIVATGSKEIIPAVPGIDAEHVIKVRNLLEKRFDARGKNIVVVGAGMTGIEAAHYMLQKGNKVDVIDMLPALTGLSITEKLTLRDAKLAGVNIHLSRRLEKINSDNIQVTDLTINKEITMPADFVVLSLGVQPNAKLYNDLKLKFENVYKIGDCDKVGEIIDAVRGGSDAAYALK